MLQLTHYTPCTICHKLCEFTTVYNRAMHTTHIHIHTQTHAHAHTHAHIYTNAVHPSFRRWIALNTTETLQYVFSCTQNRPSLLNFSATCQWQCKLRFLSGEPLVLVHIFTISHIPAWRHDYRPNRWLRKKMVYFQWIVSNNSSIFFNQA